MFPVARSSRICLFCIHYPSTLRFYASAAAEKNTTTKPRKSTSLKAKRSENNNEDALPMPNLRKPYKSRIESFLEDLDASSAPTLEDLQSMKPAVIPKDADYAQGYEQALKRVMRAFRGPQLIQLANQLGFNDKLPQTQREIAQILLEKSWDWEPPHMAERRAKQETQVSQKDIPMPPFFVLLLLLEDAHVISELGRRFGLMITLETVGGTMLQVQGHPEGISSLESYLALRAREVVTDTIDINGPDMPPSSILQVAGRHSQAFIEGSPKDNQLMFMAFDEDALRKAKRMVERYTDKSAFNTHTPMLWHTQQQQLETSTPSISKYASLPFLPQKPPAWYMSNQRLFRIKRIVEWLDNDEVPVIDSLSEGSLYDKNASTTELRERLPLLNKMPRPGFLRSYIASVGHILFSSENSSSMALLPGKWPLQTAISHIKDRGLLPNFMPSLPSPLLSSAPSSITTVHRAVYRRRLDVSTLSSKAGDVPVPSEIFLLEVAMEHSAVSPELDDLDEQDVPAETILIKPLDGLTRCQVGVEESLNVVLPERPMDIHLTIRDLQPISEQEEPEALKTYLQELLRFLNFTIDQQPSTPESIEYKGTKYFLDTSSSVRRTEEYFTPQRTEWDGLEEPEPGIEAISETSLDLESKEKLSECLIRTFDCETEEDFDVFMSKCATITSMPFTSLAQPAEEQRVPYFSE